MRELVADDWGGSLRRAWLIARYSLQALLAMRLTLLVSWVAAGFCLLALWLRTFHFGAGEAKFIRDFGLGGLSFFGVVLAALATAQLFFSEVDHGGAACVLTRAVRRTEYLGGQLVGVAAMLALYTTGLSLVVAGLLAWRAGPGILDMAWSPWLVACALQWLKLCLVAAMTLLVCSYASSALFASGLALLLALLGHWRWVADGSNWLGWLRLWPDFSRFDGERWLAAGQTPTGLELLGIAGHWLGFMLLFYGLACYVFRHREF